MRLTYIVSTCSFLTLAGAAHAVSVDFLGIIRDAAYNYPQTQAAARDVDGAQSEQSAARWQRFPTPSIQSLTPQDRSKSSATNRLILEQPLFAGGRIDAGIEAATARQVASQARYEQVAQDVAMRLANTWYDWQRNQKRQAVLTESVDAHRRLKEQIERRVREGVNPESDLTLAVARLSQTQSELAQAKSAVRNAYSQLSQLAGRQLQTLLAAPPDFADAPIMMIPPASWRTQALQRDPQLGKLAADIDAAGADIRVKRGQALPALSLRYENDFTGPQQGSRVFLQLSAQPGAGLSSVAGVNTAIARRDSAQESRRVVESELEQALDTDFTEYDAARDRLAVSTILQQSTQEVADSYSRQFVAGRKNWLDVLNAVREAASARLSIFDAKATLGQSWWRLRLRALGLGTSTGTSP